MPARLNGGKNIRINSITIFRLAFRCKKKQMRKLFCVFSFFCPCRSFKHCCDRHQSAGESEQIIYVSEDVIGAFLNGSTGFSLNSRFVSGQSNKKGIIIIYFRDKILIKKIRLNVFQTGGE